MRKLLFFLSLLSLGKLAGAQASLHPDVIAANGGVSRFNGIELEWTIGEAAAGTAASGNRLYTVGFHQPVLISRQLPVSSEDLAESIRVFPNPATNRLRVQLPFSVTGNVSIILADLTGNTLAEKTVNSKSSAIDIPVGHLAAGMYQLRVMTADGKTAGVFKIVKTN
ncbi:MAG TPA: T9SS type A sorting domain-containing protein [Chitinophagaceae bacterium]|nr:T9SS type A sorting domain-containing protein [Chitinophagaceae bacterium]